MIEFKPEFQDYTEAEFLKLVSIFFKNDTSLTGDKYDAYIDKLVDHFEAITEHPDRSAVIYYPAENEEDSPEGVVQRIKKWRTANGKPDFKPA